MLVKLFSFIAMDRRSFIKTGAAVAAAIELSKAESVASELGKLSETGIPGEIYGCENTTAGPADLTLKFLGTGAASGWDTDHSKRRFSSVLLDGKVLIDLTNAALDLIPEGCKPDVVFYTHSHGDHYRPWVALELGIRRIYVSETWIGRAKEDFAKAADELKSKGKKVTVPEIRPLTVGKRVEEKGLVFLPLPANHLTADLDEQALIYIVEKGTTATSLGVRLLYATDTGGLMAKAVKLGFSKDNPITAFIMEATVALGLEEDWRIFSHTTVELAARTVRTLADTGQYTPPEGQPPYATHMSSRGWPAQKDLEFIFPKPLRPAYDGLEVVFRAK